MNPVADHIVIIQESNVINAHLLSIVYTRTGFRVLLKIKTFQFRDKSDLATELQSPLEHLKKRSGLMTKRCLQLEFYIVLNSKLKIFRVYHQKFNMKELHFKLRALIMRVRSSKNAVQRAFSTAPTPSGESA